MISHISDDILAGAYNNFVDIILVKRDEYHNEESVQVAQDVPARIIKESRYVRTYRRDKGIAETHALMYEVMIRIDETSRHILTKIRKGDIIVFNNKEHCVIDSTILYSLSGREEYVRIIVA